VKIQQTILSLVCALLLGSCGDEGKSRPSGPAGTMDATIAASLATSSGAASDIAEFSNPSSSQLQSDFVGTGSRFVTGQRSETGCTPTIRGTSTDADFDGIPVDETTTFDCPTVTGNFNVKDHNDALAIPFAGFTFTINSFKYTGDFVGTAFSYSTSGSLDYTVALPSLTTSTQLFSDYTIGDLAVSTEYWVDASITATNVLDPLAGGTLSITGFLLFQANGTGPTLQISSAGLTYGGCSTGFVKTGTVSLVDGDGNTLLGTYTNCTVAWTYNGSAVTQVKN